MENDIDNKNNFEDLKEKNEDFINTEKEEQIVRSYISGRLTIADLEKKIINPDNVLKLEESLILKFFTKGLPNNLKYSEETLLYAYGRTLSGNAILKLSSLGYISRNKVILISNKHSLPITDPDLAAKPADILEFYSAETLASMADKNEIDYEFVRNYNTNLISSLSDEEKDNYFSNLVANTESLSKREDFPNIPEDDSTYDKIKTSQKADIKATPEDKFKKLLFYYYELGILPANYTGKIVDFNYIQKKCENHKIPYKNIVDLYVNNVITAKQFLKLLELSEVNLEQFYSGNIVSDEVLKNINSDKKSATFSEAFKSENLSVENLLNLYLYEKVLNVDDLQKILIENKVTENLGIYLNEDVDKRKIEELYTHFLIDYNCLVSLKKENTISEADFDDIKDKISSEDFYNDLSKITDLYIHTTPDNISASIHHSISGTRVSQIDFRKEQEMLHNLFGSPTEREKLPLIHATDLKGSTTALDGYTCVPMQKFNVVTLKKFETNTDTYVMPYQQAAFFLHNSYKPAEFSSNGGFQAEIPLPLEDYNDPNVISVVSYSLAYKRDLLEAICELSNEERAKSELFINGKPSNKVEAFLNEKSIVEREL